MKIKFIISKLRKLPLVKESFRLSKIYTEVTDLNSIRKELKTFLIFQKKLERNKIDIGFDVGFQNPNKDMTKLNEKLLQNQANQDRAVAISINLQKIHNRLEFIYNNARSSIYMEEGVLFDKMSKEGKDYIMQYLFSEMLEFMSDLDATMISVERMLKNMTNSHFVLMGIRETGEGIINRSYGSKGI